MNKKDSKDKRGHVCPPSGAEHPRDRWETAFVYGYIVRFTQLRSKLDGFHSPMDLEEALLEEKGLTNKLLQDILTRFILNLRPLSRNVGSSQLCSTLWNLLNDFFKTNERSIFWNHDQQANIDPLLPLEGNFWQADWDLKLKILRQLVEYQLTHSPQVKDALDRAWGVRQMQHKKKEERVFQPPDEDPMSQRNLVFEPIGQDCTRKRYWMVDNSPRIWVSTNPWKTTATFNAISSTKDEYLKAIEELKKDAPSKKPKMTKLDLGHHSLIDILEKKLEDIEAEFARIERARKKVEQRNLLLAQAEVRGPRTRRQAQRPGYVYHDGISDDDGQDDYKQEDEDVHMEDDHYEGGGGDDDAWGDYEALPQRSLRIRKSRDTGLRRSSRQTNGKSHQEDDDGSEWRGERRSRRLGATVDMDLVDEPPRKRSRTEESSDAGTSSFAGESSGMNGNSNANGSKALSASGAAALKPTEKAVDSIKGKKKNKYWFYAVEPVPDASGENASMSPVETDSPNEAPTERKSKARRVIDSAELSESGPEPSRSGWESPLPGVSAPMSLDSDDHDDLQAPSAIEVTLGV